MWKFSGKDICLQQNLAKQKEEIVLSTFYCYLGSLFTSNLFTLHVNHWERKQTLMPNDIQIMPVLNAILVKWVVAVPSLLYP